MSGQVDVNVARFNQACVAVSTGIAFVVQVWPIVPVVAALLALTRFAGARFALFTQVYLRLVKPHVPGPEVTEPVEPPRFAQLLGVLLLTVASLLFMAGLSAAGWVVTLVVTALATLAATTRICLGCIIYERTTG